MKIKIYSIIIFLFLISTNYKTFAFQNMEKYYVIIEGNKYGPADYETLKKWKSENRIFVTHLCY